MPLVAFAAMVAPACDGEPGPPPACSAAAPLRLIARTTDGKPTIAHISVESAPDSCVLAPGCLPGGAANSFCAEVHLRRIRLREVCRLAFVSARGASFRVRVAAASQAAAACVPLDPNGMVASGGSESIGGSGSSTVVNVDFSGDTSGTGDATEPTQTPSGPDSTDPHNGEASSGDNGPTPDNSAPDSTGGSDDSGGSSCDD